MTEGQGFEIGPLHFTVIRVLVAVGLARAMIRGERLAGRMNRLDWLMLAWAAWALVSSAFHKDPLSSLVYRLGLTYNACGIYLLIRVFCQSLDDVKDLCRLIAILLIPVAVEMLYEHVAFHNLFSLLGDINKFPVIREGRIRASGPFDHPILAGSIGAGSLPLIIGLWNQHRKIAIAGIIACITMIYTSSSSGPILSGMVAMGSLFMWNYRHHLKLVPYIAVFSYIGLALVMNAPAYYIIARIGVIGGSTAWHRAYLIEMASKHIHEWWLAGTDYTRHWLPYGVPWSDKHVDITNHYLHMGVVGGLLLMLLFIVIMYKGFSMVGRSIRQAKNRPQKDQFIIWTLGASLFTHSVTFLSVSYFDQSFVFLYLTLAAISSIGSQGFS